jgi:hypothetical protein
MPSRSPIALLMLPATNLIPLTRKRWTRFHDAAELLVENTDFVGLEQAAETHAQERVRPEWQEKGDSYESSRSGTRAQTVTRDCCPLRAIAWPAGAWCVRLGFSRTTVHAPAAGVCLCAHASAAGGRS